MESSRVVSNQIYYKQSDEFTPRYKYVKINMSNILGNSVTGLQASGGSVQVQFKLPYNTIFNLSKSKLATVIPVPASGTDGTYTYTVADAFPFGNQQISLETGNGLQLLNLPESARYTKVLTKVNTPFNKYATNDTSDMPHIINGGIAPANNPSGLGTSGYSLFDTQYYFTKNNAANYIPVYYELSNFVHTILSLDKDIYFGSNDMYIKYSVGPVNSFCFQKASGSDPKSGAQLTNTIAALKNVYLYLAVEQQPQIIESIVQAYQSNGLKVLIDYPIVTKMQTPKDQSNQAIVIPFVPAQGRYLKRLYHTVWATNDSFNLALDCENGSTVASGSANTTAKILSYNSYLDSMKLQDDVVTAATATTENFLYRDDWRLNQPFCKDSAISSYEIYQKNWFHCDDFTTPKSDTVGNVDPQNLKNGLPMERGLQYQFIANVASTNTETPGLIHLNFAIFSREIFISKDGVQFI